MLRIVVPFHFFFTLFLANVVLFSFKSFSASPFPEEKNRKHWDRACQDWPMQLWTSSTSYIRRNPEIVIEKAQGFFRIYAQMMIQAQPGETPESLRSSVLKMLQDPTSYPKWVMPGINTSPLGDRYFVSIDDLEIRSRVKNVLFDLTGPFTFHLLWFKRSGISTIQVHTQDSFIPECPSFTVLGLKEKVPKITFRIVPRPDLIKLMVAEAYVLTHPSFVELRMRLVAEPSSLVYQLMAESTFKGQLDVRGRKVFANFLELRTSVGAAAVSSDSSKVPQNLAKPQEK
jgi:hypothetical protein